MYAIRSYYDKYFVRDDNSQDSVWWSDSNTGKNDNHPISVEIWDHLKSLVTTQLSDKKIYVVDAFCGANKNSRLSVRFVTEVAWQAHFVNVITSYSIHYTKLYDYYSTES